MFYAFVEEFFPKNGKIRSLGDNLAMCKGIIDNY